MGYGHDAGARVRQEAGLGFTVRRDDSDFLGRDGLAARRPAERHLSCLALDADQPAMGGEPVFMDGDPVGYVTSADVAYSVGRAIALAWVPSELGAGDRVEIAYFDRRLAATIVAWPLFDPEGERLKG